MTSMFHQSMAIPHSPAAFSMSAFHKPHLVKPNPRTNTHAITVAKHLYKQHVHTHQGLQLRSPIKSQAITKAFKSLYVEPKSNAKLNPPSEYRSWNELGYHMRKTKEGRAKLLTFQEANHFAKFSSSRFRKGITSPTANTMAKVQARFQTIAESRASAVENGHHNLKGGFLKGDGHLKPDWVQDAKGNFYRIDGEMLGMGLNGQVWQATQWIPASNPGGSPKPGIAVVIKIDNGNMKMHGLDHNLAMEAEFMRAADPDLYVGQARYLGERGMFGVGKAQEYQVLIQRELKGTKLSRFLQMPGKDMTYRKHHLIGTYEALKQEIKSLHLNHKITHGDLHMENVMVMPDGSLRAMDYGRSGWIDGAQAKAAAEAVGGKGSENGNPLVTGTATGNNVARDAAFAKTTFMENAKVEVGSHDPIIKALRSEIKQNHGINREAGKAMEKEAKGRSPRSTGPTREDVQAFQFLDGPIEGGIGPSAKEQLAAFGLAFGTGLAAVGGATAISGKELRVQK